MSTIPIKNLSLDPPSAWVEQRVEPVAQELHDALGRLLASIPGGPHGPTSLSKLLGVNRVTVSNLVNAVKQPDPYQVIQRIPGPDSLRTLTRAAREVGIAEKPLERADRAIDSFASLIREQFGTRGALNAAISPADEGLQKRFEETGRYHIYRGMREVLGVAAETWLTSMIFVPQPDGESVGVTTIHGALAMRRLRPDVNVYFSFGPPYHAPDTEPDLLSSPIGLQELYTNEPAPLETSVSEGKLVHRLIHDQLGQRATVDMLAVSHNARGSRRYAAPGRPRGGVALFVDVPVKTMIVEALLHPDIFPGAKPELMVYNPGARGPANPNDPARDIDRFPVSDRVERVDESGERFSLPEVPRYAEMVERVFAQIGQRPEGFRQYRLRMMYPIYGFQFVMAFAAPERPGDATPG